MSYEQPWSPSSGGLIVVTEASQGVTSCHAPLVLPLRTYPAGLALTVLPMR
jgi:hypothetical protein